MEAVRQTPALFPTSRSLPKNESGTLFCREFLTLHFSLLGKAPSCTRKDGVLQITKFTEPRLSLARVTK